MNWTSCRHRVSVPKGYYCHASALRFAKALLSPLGGERWRMQAEPTGRRKQSRDRSISINRSRSLQKKKIKGLIHPALAAAEKKKMGAELIG